jgi:transcriptional regulator with XRE-family HTH domain
MDTIKMLKELDVFKIAENIRELRLANGMTQFELSELLGYTERHIRRLEANGTYDIGVINLIASTFNIPVIEILF